MRAVAAALVAAALPPSVHPWPIGVGPRYHPPARIRDGHPVGGLRCDSEPLRTAVHLELFARQRVIVVPAGIGRGPSCTYPLRTFAPTGVVGVAGRAMLGDLFRVWGMRLGRDRLLTFSGRVRAFVGGREIGGDPRRITLRPHCQIVLEVGGYVPPHPSYLFPKGTP